MCDNYSLEIKTVQSAAFRVLTEALKEILTDANFEIDSTGIKVMAMDSSHTVLVHLKLNANNFEHYYCEEKKILGVNMLNFFKLIKTMGNSDTLSLFLEKDNESVLGIKIENSEKNTTTKYSLNLMDLHEENIQIPAATFNSVITMPSVDFQKICRDMHNLADNLEIRSTEKQLIFSCKGHFASQETSIGETNSGLSFVKNENPDEIVQGIFALKHLVLFSKCTNLCNSIELYLKNDYPLILKYSVASLGDIKLCLAPKCE
jgi:proliferating cell nuclear antigen|tara:strand:+ start:902 stop:1684 length:783 start_codon:yes stop_codon:yes gene_type:complete